MRYLILFLAALTTLNAQEPPASAGDDTRGYNDTPQIIGQKWRVHDMARPRPVKVVPGALPSSPAAPPSDAIILFDGKDLSQWKSEGRHGEVQEPRWKVGPGYMEITPDSGRLVTRQSFGDCQLHIEWMIPESVTGKGQGRGNSGVEFMTRYEIQVLETNQNLTYADGGAGAIYGVWPPLVNPQRPQGQWNVYDIYFEAPVFDGVNVVKRANVTVIFNGVLVQNHKEFLGQTTWRANGVYTPHPALQPLSLQDHHQVVRYRNIWIRNTKEQN